MANRDAAESSSSMMDTSPLLQRTPIEEEVEREPIRNRTFSQRRRGPLSRLIRLLRGASAGASYTGGGVIRESSFRVRETAAEHLEERRSDWAYSKPIVILDLLWNFSFIVVAIVVLILSRADRPSNSLRLWIVVYAAQCCIHMACVCLEYRWRRWRLGNTTDAMSSSFINTITNTTTFDTARSGTTTSSSWSYSQGDPEQGGLSYSESLQSINESNDDNVTLSSVVSTPARLVKRIESANTCFSFVWWIIGFYWTTSGNQSHDAPILFWLCVGFLAFDVFFVVFCFSLACVIGIAVCCCLPCIIAIMYAVAEQEGVSEEDIDLLPKYKFQRSGSYMDTGDTVRPSGGVMSPLDSTSGSPERALSPEDAECCICISSYDDGVEIRELPCGHHFHCTCIDRWLHMNSTCPLCKLNIPKRHSSGREDV